MAQLNFGIHETPYSEGVRLTVLGELDVASAPILEVRLKQLSAERSAVRLDLSRLEFIDSSGIRVLFTAVRNARSDGWRFEIEPNLSRQATRVFKLVSLDRHIASRD